jgi:hypothetical protein
MLSAWRCLMLMISGAAQLLLILLLLSSPVIKARHQTELAPAAGQEIAPAGLECKTYCSDVKLRTPIAELTWPASATASLERQGLEVTVYKNGFERGLSARLLVVRQGEKFSLQRAAAAVSSSAQRVPGLDKLVVVGVRTRSMRLRASSVNTITVQVEGLEPGLNYYWRVLSNTSGTNWVANRAYQTVRCQAPVCPADMQPEESTKP